MLKFTNPWKKQTSHLIISWISSFSYLTPNHLPESQAVIAIFCLFWTREVSPYGRWTFWILSIGSIQATCVFLYFRILGTFAVTDLTWRLDLSTPKKINGTSLQKRRFYCWKALNVHLCHPFAVGGRSWLEEQRQWWGLGARCAVGRMLRFLDWKSILRKAGWQNPSPGGRFANLCNFKKWSKTPLNELISSTAFVRDWNASIWYTYIYASDFRCKACWVYCKRDLAKTEVLVGQHLFCSIFLYF